MPYFVQAKSKDKKAGTVRFLASEVEARLTLWSPTRKELTTLSARIQQMEDLLSTHSKQVPQSGLKEAHVTSANRSLTDLQTEAEQTPETNQVLFDPLERSAKRNPSAVASSLNFESIPTTLFGEEEQPTHAADT